MIYVTLCGEGESDVRVIGPFESFEDARADAELSTCDMPHQHLPAPKVLPKLQSPSTTPQERRWHLARAAAARGAQ